VSSIILRALNARRTGDGLPGITTIRVLALTIFSRHRGTPG